MLIESPIQFVKRHAILPVTGVAIEVGDRDRLGVTCIKFSVVRHGVAVYMISYSDCRYLLGYLESTQHYAQADFLADLRRVADAAVDHIAEYGNFGLDQGLAIESSSKWLHYVTSHIAFCFSRKQGYLATVIHDRVVLRGPTRPLYGIF